MRWPLSLSYEVLTVLPAYQWLRPHAAPISSSIAASNTSRSKGFTR